MRPNAASAANAWRCRPVHASISFAIAGRNWMPREKPFIQEPLNAWKSRHAGCRPCALRSARLLNNKHGIGQVAARHSAAPFVQLPHVHLIAITPALRRHCQRCDRPNARTIRQGDHLLRYSNVNHKNYVLVVENEGVLCGFYVFPSFLSPVNTVGMSGHPIGFARPRRLGGTGFNCRPAQLSHLALVTKVSRQRRTRTQCQPLIVARSMSCTGRKSGLHR